MAVSVLASDADVGAARRAVVADAAALLIAPLPPFVDGGNFEPARNGWFYTKTVESRWKNGGLLSSKLT